MKIKFLTLLVTLGLFSSLTAFAQEPEYVVITDPGELYSTYTISADEWTRLVTAVGYTKANEIKIGSQEGLAWPATIRKLEDRLANANTISEYTAKFLTSIADGVSVLEINAAENAYMPEGFRPSRNFYFIMSSAGFVYLSDLVEENVGTETNTTEESSNGEQMTIIDAGKICSTYDITGVVAAENYYKNELGLSSEDFTLLSSLSKESAWPAGMSTLSGRNSNRDKIYNYVTYYVGTWMDEGKSYTMVWAPMDENAHMETKMQPATADGIFIIFESEGVKFMYR